MRPAALRRPARRFGDCWRYCPSRPKSETSWSRSSRCRETAWRQAATTGVRSGQALLMAEEPVRDRFLRMHAVNVYVRDQERSLRFFLDTLGFQVAFDARVESGQRLVAVAPPDGTTVLTLIQPPRQSLQFKLIGRATQVVFVTENLAATYREWHSRGVRFLGAPRLRRVAYEPAGASSAGGRTSSDDNATAWGGAFARFEDLDRNSFALVS